MKHSKFIGWFCILAVLIYIPFSISFYKSSDLQYITLQNAKVESYYSYRTWYAKIDDIYYCPINAYPEEYENIRSMAEVGEICIGFVKDFSYHFVIPFNDYDYRVVTVYSPKVDSMITLERYNKNAKPFLWIFIVLLLVYLMLSLLYWYFLSDGKLINKWRKYRKKQKKLNYKKRHKKKQQKAKKT